MKSGDTSAASWDRSGACWSLKTIMLSRISIVKAIGTRGEASTRLRLIKPPYRRSEAGMKPMRVGLIFALSGLFDKDLRGRG